VVKTYQRSRLQVVELSAGANIDAVVTAYERSPLVSEAGRSRIASSLDGPNDTNYSAQWDMHDTASGIRVEPAWAASANKGAGVVVAVIDTGVAYETYTRPAVPGLPEMSFEPAPDLGGTVFVAPKNYVNDDNHANDDNGHGSHVTGTIRQTTNNAYGVVGVAYNATIMPIKVLDWQGAGADADLVDAIYYAVDNGADVISMSLGFTGTGTPDGDGNFCTEVVGLNAAPTMPTRMTSLRSQRPVMTAVQSSPARPRIRL
jgi:serine protease